MIFRFVANSKEHEEYLNIKYKKCHKKAEDHDKSEKIYKCDKCPRHFHKEWTSNWHKKNVHEGLKKFKCESCDSGFRTQGKLRKHLKKHEGQKFKCEIKQCDKIFPSRNELNSHILFIHGYFKCKHCEEEFPKEQN